MCEHQVSRKVIRTLWLSNMPKLLWRLGLAAAFPLTRQSAGIRLHFDKLTTFNIVENTNLNIYNGSKIDAMLGIDVS